MKKVGFALVLALTLNLTGCAHGGNCCHGDKKENSGCCKSKNGCKDGKCEMDKDEAVKAEPAKQ